MLEHLGVNLSLLVVGLESLDNKIIRVVSISSHLFLEHLDHVVVGACTSDLTKKTIKFSLSLRTPTLSKAPRRSFLSIVPSLLMSISLKQSLYIWSCSSEKPPSFCPLPILDMSCVFLGR